MLTDILSAVFEINECLEDLMNNDDYQVEFVKV